MIFDFYELLVNYILTIINLLIEILNSSKKIFQSVVLMMWYFDHIQKTVIKPENPDVKIRVFGSGNFVFPELKNSDIYIWVFWFNHSLLDVIRITTL